MSFNQPGFGGQPQPGYGQPAYPQAQPGYPPQPGYAPQPGYGQQAPAAPAPITQSADEFWASNGGSGGAPSYNFTEQEPMVKGTIVDMQGRQRTDFATKVPKFNKDGKPQMQLEVTLQTDLRNWQGVKPDKIPTWTNPATGQVEQQPPQNDDGKRRIYVWFKMRDAVEEAFRSAGLQQPLVGDLLAVQLVGYEPTQGGNPTKLYKAWYQRAAGAQEFFDQGSAPAAAPQAAPAPAPQASPALAPAPAPQAAPAFGAPPAQPAPQGFPQAQAAPAPAPAQPQQQAPAGWGAAATDEPPF